MYRPYSFLALAILFTLTSFAWAGVYKIERPDGSVVFTDEPIEGAEEIDIKPLPSFNVPASKAPTTPTKVKEEKKATAAYKTISIVNPKHDGVVRNNEGMLSIQLRTEPALKSGHRVRILLDGSEAAEPKQTNLFVLSPIDPGSHTLAAQIIDDQNRILANSSAITVHLKRFTAK